MSLPGLYHDMAEWWPLLSSPEEYTEEASWIMDALIQFNGGRPAGLLELGSGGGNLASHLIPHIPMTLVDISAQMLAVSRRLNPGTEHVVGDMRHVHLGKMFEAVLIHDAIMYMARFDDLVAALKTARAHLEPGGSLVVVPDCVTETFECGTEMGGHDAPDGRGLRYLLWTQPATGASTFDEIFAFLLRLPDGSIEVRHERHCYGLFTRAQWRQAFHDAGLAAPEVRIDPWQREVFFARHPA